ncbi:MAG TPA: hypothetical protein VMC79_16315 [Rectinemataceae bacterium]|nr:hypothetical protein [Rectinemataceae bacterium]
MTSFSWKDLSGSSLAFHDQGKRAEGGEALFSDASPADRYTLFKPEPMGDSEAIELLLHREQEQAGLSVKVRVIGSGKSAAQQVAAEIVLRDPNTYFVIPIAQGFSLSALELRLAEPESGAQDSAPSFSLRSITFRPRFVGFERLRDGVRLSSGFSLYTRDRNEYAVLRAPFPHPAATSGQPDTTSLYLDYGPVAHPAVLELSPARATGGRLRIRTRSGGLQTSLDAMLFPANPESLELQLPEAVELRAFFAAPLDPDREELADLGRVLLSSPRDPSRDFDLYRWDRFPAVLVFDFRDYAAQDRYLKRIAFFTEKIGFRGRLASDREIATLHGWNAHDYRPADLAAFFQAARSSNFPLNAEERDLQAILVRHGIIVDEGGQLRAGDGAFISISRESPAYLRTQLIVHESTHAIFFVDPDYRSFVFSAWASIGEDERWFWKLYFSWAGYDTSSEYLMANEFQAYLLQQPLARTFDYFSKTWVTQILQKHPEYKTTIDAYLERFGDRYQVHARTLDAWLEQKYGLGAGRTYAMY